MRTMILIALFMCPSVFADDIILTGGKKITWKTLTDNGDTYIVEDAEGRRTMILKSSVERIEKAAAPLPPPLTGATFAFDKKAKLVSLNLIPLLDLKKAIVTGQWSFEKGVLVGSSPLADNSRLELPMEAPQEYDLTIDVARKNGVGDFDIGLVGGGHQFIVAFDSSNCTLSGIGLIEGKPLSQHGQGIPGRFFTDEKPKSIVCMVRKENLIVQVDGKDFLSYSGGWDKLSNHQGHDVRSKKVPFLIVWNGSMGITRAIMSYPKPNP